MAAKKPPGSKDSGWTPPIEFERLNAMIEAVQSGPLSDLMRVEIADALDCLYVTLMIEQDAHALGRRTDPRRNLEIMVMHALIIDHKASQKAAACAVSSSKATPSQIDALCRGYRTAASTWLREKHSLNSSVVESALKRLPSPKR